MSPGLNRATGEHPQRQFGRGGERSASRIFGGGLERRQQGGEEDLVVGGSTAAAGDDDRALDRLGKQCRPVIGLLRPHRETVDAGDPVDAEVLGEQVPLRADVVERGDETRIGLDDRPLPNISGVTMNQRVGSRFLSWAIGYS
jgi:hypothetical protein